MDSTLTVNGVHQLIQAEGLFTDRHHPTLQVTKIRRVPANALTDVFWVSQTEALRRIYQLTFIRGTHGCI